MHERLFGTEDITNQDPISKNTLPNELRLEISVIQCSTRSCHIALFVAERHKANSEIKEHVTQSYE
jgi:hypothetical protein